MSELATEFWKKYLTDVLGVEQFMPMPSSTAQVLEEEFFWKKGPNSPWQKDLPVLEDVQQPFLFLSCLQSLQEPSLFSSEASGLLDKMQAAMKWSDDQVLRMEFVGPQMNPVYQELIQWPFSAVILFSRQPDRQGVQSLPSKKWIETYGPQILLEKPELKKATWEDLQKLSKKEN